MCGVIVNDFQTVGDANEVRFFDQPDYDVFVGVPMPKEARKELMFVTLASGRHAPILTLSSIFIPVLQRRRSRRSIGRAASGSTAPHSASRLA